MTDAQMESFIWDLAKLGFCWQFITLAGFHCDALSIDLFAKDTEFWAPHMKGLDVRRS